MESTTLSPNGAAGAAPTHTLADPAAEQMLDTILATPFAEADPPADLAPAAAIDAMMPMAADAAEPDADPGAEPPAEEPEAPAAEVPADEPTSLPEGMPPFIPENLVVAEPAAPAAETQPEPEAPAEEAAQETVDTDQLRATITMQYQPNEFALFHNKAVEITARHENDTLFSGHYVTIDKATGKIVAGTKIEMQPVAQLEPIRNATSLLKLRKGLMLRAAEVLDAMVTALGQEIEKVEACMVTLAAAKTAIRDLLPEKGKDLIF